MSDVRAEQEEAILTVGDRTARLPILRATDGTSSIDVSTLTRQTGYTALDYGFVNTAATKSAITFIDGDQDSPLSRVPDRPACEELDLPRGRLAPHLRRAAHGLGARRLRQPHPPPHAPARRPQALLLGSAAHGPPHVGALFGGLRPLDLLRERDRPHKPEHVELNTIRMLASSRSSPPTHTRRASVRRSSTPTTR